MAETPPAQQALRPGSRLEEFEIIRELGSGGFGVTYIAFDHSLRRDVVIKENLPVFAFRDPSTSTVHPRSTLGEDAELFAWSLTNFVREAQTLAKFLHPNIVPVLRVFEANGTAYFVMPFVEGRPLSDAFKQHAGQPYTEKELRSLLMPLLDALEHLHAQQVYHRDIKPGNVLLQADGKPVLIDFGSARQLLSQKSLTVVESPGYTPSEQLESRGNVGPWSDLYALAATLYKAITGENPPKAMDRIKRDPIRSLARDYAGAYSVPFLAIIDRALNFDEEKRPQSVAEWRAALLAVEQRPVSVTTRVPVPLARQPRPPQAVQRVKPSPVTPITRREPTIQPTVIGSRNHAPWLAAVAVLALGVAAWAVFTRPAEKAQDVDLASHSAKPEAPPAATTNASLVAPQTGPALPSYPRASGSKTRDPGSATKEAPFENSLGMRLVPLPAAARSANGSRVLFSIWECRGKDYAVFMADPNRVYQMTGSDTNNWWNCEYKGVPVGRSESERAESSLHPVQSVSWDDASAFCAWLTRKEQLGGQIGPQEMYRLPTDLEWSFAAGIGEQDLAAATPKLRGSSGQPGVYPWGGSLIPSSISGNYCDETAKARGVEVGLSIAGYHDGYATTSPVGQFKPNELGIYDLGGNVWEWCSDWYDDEQKDRVLRGGSWVSGALSSLLSSDRFKFGPNYRNNFSGFRVVLVVPGG